MTTCICGRSPRGFAWHDFSVSPFDRDPPVHCCSITCLDIAHERRGRMDINIEEAKAIEAASPAIGEYLERIGKTDLAQMNEEEWLGFLAHAYTATCDQVRALWGEAVPF